jgi:hypothetical protein
MNQTTIDEVNSYMESSNDEVKELCSVQNTDEQNIGIIVKNDFVGNNQISPAEVERVLKEEWLFCNDEEDFARVTRAFKVKQENIDKYVDLFKDCKEVYYGVSALYSTINEYLMGDDDLADRLFENDEYFRKDQRFKSWCFDEFEIGYFTIGDVVYVNAGNDCGCDDALYIVGIK